MPLWHVAITFLGDLEEDAAVAIMGDLMQFGAAIAVDRDFLEGTVTLTLEERTFIDAAVRAVSLISEATPEPLDYTSLEVATAERDTDPLAEPLFPTLIGLRGISRITRTSPRHAAKFVRSPSFPRPVSVTPQGPLYWAHAVERWFEIREQRQAQHRTQHPAD